MISKICSSVGLKRKQFNIGIKVALTEKDDYDSQILGLHKMHTGDTWMLRLSRISKHFKPIKFTSRSAPHCTPKLYLFCPQTSFSATKQKI